MLSKCEGEVSEKASPEVTAVDGSQSLARPPWSAGYSHENQTNTTGLPDGVSLRSSSPLFSLPSSSASPPSQLSELIYAHRQRQSELRVVGEQAWNDVQRNAQIACESILVSSDEEVSCAFAREKEIEKVLKEIASQSAQLQRQMSAWSALFVTLNGELKEMGDVSNWARRIEDELVATVGMLEELSLGKRRLQGIE